MTLLQAIILGLIQGITELLPISSSGHLVLTEAWMHLDVEKLKSFDVALHVGTLGALVLYFRKDILGMLLLKNKTLVLQLILAMIPAVIAGLLLNDWLDATFRSPSWVAFWMIFVGIFFLVAEKMPKVKKQETITFKNAALIGIGQMFALIPGVSRSGITIISGMFQGITREAAARFSFLLGSVAIAAAALFTVVKGEPGGGDAVMVSNGALAAGMLAAFVSSFAAISFLMPYLRKHSLAIFAYYRFALGVGLVLLTKL